MRSAGNDLAALLDLAAATAGDERRRLWRRGLAALAAAAEIGPAPLEGLDPAQLLGSVRLVLADPELDDWSWMSPSHAARVQVELAQAVPPGSERRELGRRVIRMLREGDRQTFLVLATALALSSPRALDPAAVRARLEVVLAAPLSAPGGVGALALALIARPELSGRWLLTPSTGSLPERRLAARLLAHAAREVMERGGDGAELFGLADVASAHRRLLTDREALVWRFAAVARGIIAHARSEIAAEIDHELQLGGDAVRRAATSAAAALERGGMALRWQPLLAERSRRDPGVARAVLQGLAGLAATQPAAADALAAATVPLGGLDAVEALVDLVREEGDLPLPRARAAAIAWLDAQDRGRELDDGLVALALALRAELAGQGAPGALASAVRATRDELDGGHLAAAVGHARTGLDELAAIVDWLERASEDDPLDRRHTQRALRELERELLADGTLAAALTLADGDGAGLGGLTAPTARLERTLLAREASPETAGALPNFRLRLTRLRVLVRLLDGAGGAAAPGPGARLPALQVLVQRARDDQSPLRRAVWAAMTRTWDALLRDDDLEVSDLLLAMTSWFDPGEDFAIVREATMVPAVELALDAYQQLMGATWAAADPDDTTALARACERLADLGKALPRAASPRVEALRDAIAAAARAVAVMVRASGRAAVPPASLDELTRAVGALSAGAGGARRRIGLPIGADLAAPAEAMTNLRLALERSIRAGAGAIDDEVAAGRDALRGILPPAITDLVITVLTRVARLPVETDNLLPLIVRGVGLPSWLPMSRSVGGFHLLAPIGTGGGGSVFVACRSDDRTRAQPETFALKVPDYGGTAAGTMSEREFEALFRQEAGALLALPPHRNLAGFITFDAGARPKPILVMELVPGPTLERLLDRGGLDMSAALTILDGLAAGLSAMHGARVAHLDIKPQNVILREAGGEPHAPPDLAAPGPAAAVPVLVDFGLAGRQLRPGCGSPHYGAPEVWQPGRQPGEPFPSDVYALSCVAFEVVTNTVLVDGPNLNNVLRQHYDGHAARRVRRAFGTDPALAGLGELLVAGLAVDPHKRPSIDRFRAGLAAVAPDVRHARWPASADAVGRLP